jgi:hypothetical protein
MTAAQRTPGPWHYGEPGNHQGLVIAERTGANVAVTYAKDDASFIVLACNSHDALLADVAKLRAAINALLDDVSDLDDDARAKFGGKSDRSVVLARAALQSTAGGTTP